MPSNFECYTCNTKFQSQRDLNNHLGNRVYLCPYGCGDKYVHQWEHFSHHKFCAGGRNTKSHAYYNIFNK